jgi:hypothetical protein
MVLIRACDIERDGYLYNTTRHGFARDCQDEGIGHPRPL